MSDDQEPFREGDIRVREFNAGALVNFRQVRRVQTLAGTFHAASEHVECEACTPALVEDATRRALRAGWAFDGSRRYGYSISDEEGLVRRRRANGRRERLALMVMRVPSWPTCEATCHSVRATPRWPVAWREPTRGATRRFAVSSARRQRGLVAAPHSPDFDAVALLRGFDTADLSGRHAVVANLDYRVPLVWIERGPGTWPFFVRSSTARCSAISAARGTTAEASKRLARRLALSYRPTSSSAFPCL